MEVAFVIMEIKLPCFHYYGNHVRLWENLMRFEFNAATIINLRDICEISQEFCAGKDLL